jgi:hypothetical protein
MNRALLGLIAAIAITGSVTFAHGNALHVRGTVTAITGRSVTVQPVAKDAKVVTFTVADHTEIDKGTKVASVTDLKVGDRVLVEIPKGKTEAESIKIGVGAAAKPSAAPADHKHNG